MIMESVISVMNIPKLFKNRIVSHQLKIDLEQKLEKSPTILECMYFYFVVERRMLFLHRMSLLGERQCKRC